MKNTITITLYTDHGDTEETVELPAKWEICPACDGCGTDRGRSVECDNCYGEPGGFTSSEWAEQDDDFKRDYLAGVYDRPCPHCTGHAGRVQEVDRERCPPDLLAAYDKSAAEERDYQALCRMERRMGA